MKPLITPILLITFNRPDHVRRVLGEIRLQQPKQLFIAQDGPRDWQEGFEKYILDNGRVVRADDYEKIKAVRTVITDMIDWPCEMHTLFQELNLGCGPGPATGISWFFDNVEMGIVMEDDCVPSPTLLHFYEELLAKYKDDERISLITGTNALSKWRSYKYDYIFSKTGGMTMGSWASWRRAWNYFDWEIKCWHEPAIKEQMQNMLGEKRFVELSPIFDSIYANPPRDAWDFQWAFARILHNTYSIVSTVNQMSNIGFGDESTHTPNKNDRRSNMVVFNCRLPLRHHSFWVDKLFDWEMYQRFDRKTKKGVMLKLLLKFIDLICQR